MKIGIDASRYSHSEATGVEWYSWHMINNLLSISDDEIILYSREPIYVENVKNKVIKGRRFWTLFALSREMRKSPPDVLFVPSHTLPLSLPKRSVITIHDVAFKNLRRSYSLLQYLYLDWSTKYAVKKASNIIVPSEQTKKDLVNFYNCLPEKISVIPHGFDIPKQAGENMFEKSEMLKYFGISKDMKYILFIGRLESKKNLERLIEAFSIFSKGNPDFKFILAGKRGVGFSRILNKANKLEIMDKIIMPGYITEEEKSILYKHCQMFVFPSLYEGFGLPILEAFYYKKPVLCSDSSSLPEVAGEAAYYVNPYDIESITTGLEVLSKNDGYVKDLCEKGFQRLEKFSWSQSAQETLKVLHGQ